MVLLFASAYNILHRCTPGTRTRTFMFTERMQAQTAGVWLSVTDGDVSPSLFLPQWLSLAESLALKIGSQEDIMAEQESRRREERILSVCLNATGVTFCRGIVMFCPVLLSYKDEVCVFVCALTLALL